MSDITNTAKREVERTREAVKDAKDQLSEAMRSAGGPPAEDEDQAVRQIEAIRGKLERDLEVLKARVPDPQHLLERYGDRFRTVGLAVAGGALAVAGTLRTARRRRAHKEQGELVRAQAAAIAHELARIEFHELAEDERAGRGRGAMLLALAAAGAGAAAYARQRRQTGELDVWDPPPTMMVKGPDDRTEMIPVTSTPPAHPTDVDEVPPIPGADQMPPTRP